MLNVNPEGARNHNEVSFGPFRLAPAERLTRNAGVAVPLGGRALNILIILLERAGEVVSKRDLIERVWPAVTVDEGSLRFHVGALRKALGDGQAGARYVANVPGRVYCFVAPVSRTALLRLAAHEDAASPKDLTEPIWRLRVPSWKIWGDKPLTTGRIL